MTVRNGTGNFHSKINVEFNKKFSETAKNGSKCNQVALQYQKINCRNFLKKYRSLVGIF
jgi:hypothetical protein